MTVVMDAQAIAAQAGNQPPAGGDQSFRVPAASVVPPATQAPQTPPAVPPAQTQSTSLSIGTQSAAPAQQTDSTATLLKSLVEQVGTLTAAHKKTEAQSARQSVLNAITGTATGTEEDFNGFANWARNGGMDASQIAALDAVLKSGDPNIQTALIAGYAAQYRATLQNPETSMITGNTNMIPQQDASKGYLSEQAFRAIMKTDKYKTDPQFAASQDELRKRSMAMEAQARRGY